MEPNTIAAIVAAVAAVAASMVAIAGLPATRKAAEAARLQAVAAREQTELQLELARAAVQPRIWADIQPDNKQGTILQLVLRNDGPSVARNVVVTIDPPLPKDTNYADRIDTAEQRLAHGIRSIAPGRSIEWSLGPAYDLMQKRTLPAVVHMVRLTADGPHGPIEPVELEIDLDEWRESRDAPDGSLHVLKQSVDKVAAQLKSLNDLARKSGWNAPDHRFVVETSIADTVTRQLPEGPGAFESEAGDEESGEGAR